MSASIVRAHAANMITALRLALVIALWLLPTSAAWTLLGIGIVAAVLDAIDGPIARRTGSASRFGARFDMETDALLIVTLSVLVWRLDKAGPWIIAAGAMRYLFVAAGAVLPWLNAELPPSLRRKALCVVQIVGLLVALGPIVPRPVSSVVAGAGLLALTWSFAVDIRWLSRRVSGSDPIQGTVRL